MDFGFRLREREAEVSYCSAAIWQGTLEATDTTREKIELFTYLNRSKAWPVIMLPYKVKINRIFKCRIHTHTIFFFQSILS